MAFCAIAAKRKTPPCSNVPCESCRIWEAQAAGVWEEPAAATPARPMFTNTAPPPPNRPSS